MNIEEEKALIESVLYLYRLVARPGNATNEHLKKLNKIRSRMVV